jgi:nicotinamidase-related amidase
VFPGATLFFDVGVQRDLWPGGRWPIVAPREAAEVAALFGLARELGIRQGGIVCAHAAGDELGGRPRHCERGTAGAERPEACLPVHPLRVSDAAEASPPPGDRGHAEYVASGCCTPVDAAPVHRRALDHLAAGIRDAVIFGALVEDHVAHAVDALLARRVRVHVALDAVGTADPEHAQRVVAVWKRRFVDGTTVAELARALRRAAGSN